MVRRANIPGRMNPVAFLEKYGRVSSPDVPGDTTSESSSLAADGSEGVQIPGAVSETPLVEGTVSPTDTNNESGQTADAESTSSFADVSKDVQISGAVSETPLVEGSTESPVSDNPTGISNSTSPVSSKKPPKHPRLQRFFDQIAGQDNAKFDTLTAENEQFESRPDVVLACLGDSLTHGRCSFDYAQQVRESVDDSVEVINAGTNGDLAWNLLQRLDKVIACNPDYTSILIGTNDITAIQSDALLKAYRRVKHIPADIVPDVSWYIQTVRTIIERLQSETQSEVVVFTLPMIAEQASDDINLRVDNYNSALKALCTELGVDILDLNQAQKATLMEAPADFQLKGYDEKRVEKEIDRAPWFHFALLWDWEKISKRCGYYTLIDGVHLNKRGGSLVSELLVNWLKTRRNR